MKINVFIHLEDLNLNIWLNFDKSFNNGEKVYLSTNYRSKKNIVDISKKLISNNVNRNDKEIIII